MSAVPPHVECARRLALLEGDDFEVAITGLLANNHQDFQSIPAAPQGDGGLDGLAENFTVGYCCYGIENIDTLAPKAVAKKTLDKFKADLMRILEFNPKKPKKLIPHPNTTLSKVFPAKTKLKHIYLVVNSFKSNTVIGPLNTWFAAIKPNSPCTYMEPACTITIEGPHEITNRLTVTPSYQARLESSLLSKMLNQPTAPTTAPSDLSGFDDKMNVLASVSNPVRVQALRNNFHQQWLSQLGMLEELNNNHPQAHKRIFATIEAIREEVIVKFLSATPQNLADRLMVFETDLADRLHTEIPLPKQDAQRFARRVTAQLVGECDIDWR
ncbi:hypothetical protein [Corallococcus sicarius]|uniref:hypothetical protein n=1 Tax=Corallococcus sicarius TaxID=2316726 RepID=UPI0011C3FAFA|nr:hypothetical protein [Corallococcus sicarius]